MKLVKDDIIRVLNQERDIRSLISPKFRGDEQYKALVIDCDVVREICLRAQTIIFPTEILVDLIANIDRIDLKGDLHLPYPYLIIQLSTPLKERDVLPYPESLSQRVYDQNGNFIRQERIQSEDDMVLCFCYGNPYDDPKLSNDSLRSKFVKTFSIWFSSLSVNRSAWRMDQTTGEPILAFEKYLGKKDSQMETQANKERILKLAYAIGLFLNAENVKVDRVSIPASVNAKRERKGKTALPDYHVVNIEKIIPVYKPNGRTGSKHSRMYPVRGHFRRIKGREKPVWIHNHYRGLENGMGSLVSEIYQVNPKK